MSQLTQVVIQSISQTEGQTVIWSVSHSVGQIRQAVSQSIGCPAQKEPLSDQNCIAFTQKTVKKVGEAVYEDMLTEDEISTVSSQHLLLIGPCPPVLLHLPLRRQEFVCDGQES